MDANTLQSEMSGNEEGAACTGSAAHTVFYWEKLRALLYLMTYDIYIQTACLYLIAITSLDIFISPGPSLIRLQYRIELDYFEVDISDARKAVMFPCPPED